MSKEELVEVTLKPEPEYEAHIWINARDSPDLPCGLHPLGFDIKAFWSDYIRVDLRGTKDFLKRGAWITIEELQSFVDELQKILDRFARLSMMHTDHVIVLWDKPREDP